MGGLIKRKNRSLPNLRADDDDGQEEQQQEPEEDEYVGLPAAGPPTEDALCNPNLEKSKLMMRRSFYSSSEILILYWCEVGVTRLSNTRRLSHNTRKKKNCEFCQCKMP
jgi:hypothetical protein